MMDIPSLAQELAQRQLTLTSAESLTSGTFQSELAATPEAHDVYPGGFITYATSAKTKILGISPELIEAFGVVSEAVAVEMAWRAKSIVQTDLALGFTGVAGPGRLEGQPVGTVCIGCADHRGVVGHTYHFDGTPAEIMAQSCQAGVELLVARLGD